MKSLKLILVVIAISFTTNTQAQLLKKLGKAAERAAERTLERKVDEKATKETEKTFDSTFNKKKKTKKEKRRSKTKKTNTSVAESYSFTHKYALEIKSNKNIATINYYLNSDKSYIGSSMDLQTDNTNIISVMDIARKTMVMFMDTSNMKTQMTMEMDFESMTDDSIEDQQVKITPTGKTKRILNYLCHEYQVSGTDYNGNIWVTQDAGVSFSKSFLKAKTKKGLNQSWMSMINGLTMEMNITDTSNRKPQNIQMKCIALEKTSLNINSSDYKKMM